MSNLEYKLFYRKTLPHIQPPGATLFVTYRLAGSIPRAVLNQLLQERRREEQAILALSDKAIRKEKRSLLDKIYFAKWDAVLD